MERNGKKVARRGSALLIVLGFLSFMIVSAVSFAVYMRIERQASSNYRHTIMARHMLNAALCRAVDEIDSDLRDNTYSAYKKFPAYWDHHVRSSAVESGDDLVQKAQDARVLSAEALNYIPGCLVNDVRRYAVRNPSDNDPVWQGAKWRPLSMPLVSLGDQAGNVASADGDAVVGRYAYVCVNLSDMLDANDCNASLRHADSNRVSIAHLFADTTIGKSEKASYDGYKTSDYHYETLQDYYACMKQHGMTTFQSPYLELLNTYAGDFDDSQFTSDKANKHILTTDTLAKTELLDSASTTPTPYRIDPAKPLSTTIEECADTLSKMTWPGTGTPGSQSDIKEHFENMLGAYLTAGNDPYWNGKGIGPMYRPSVRMVPMIYQFVLPAAASIKPRSTLVPATSGSGPTQRTICSLRLLEPGSQIPVLIQTIFPFKHWNGRKLTSSGDFTMEASAYIALVKVQANGNLTTLDSTLKGLAAPFCFKLNLPTTQFSQLMPSDETVPFPIASGTAVFSAQAYDIQLYEEDSSGNITRWFNGFNAGDQVRAALVIFAGVKNSNGVFVDLVPGWYNPTSPQAPNNLNTAILNSQQFGFYERLFFESDVMTINQNMSPDFKLQWSSLEVPDARFNHKAANWIRGSKTSPDSSIGTTLAAQVFGQNGRDSDIYMSVSGLEKLYSPGEFGFLLRPIKDPNSPPQSVTLATQTQPSNAEDYPYMFRTVRLYDHGDHTAVDKKSDDVYKYFYAANSDDSLIGSRVNPLSNLTNVLEAAVQNTPFDYYWAAQASQSGHQYNKTWDTQWGGSADSDPADCFIKKWADCLIKASVNVNQTLNNHISDYYGDWNYFHWYNASAPNTIFNSTTLNSDLSEIDRKMLYSFSLDSFCDRQQLFLYILRAEAIPPGFGASSASSGGKSLAGGRAVALVWRDPYPKKKGVTFSFSPDSPWTRYGASGSRSGELHDFRVLFFKELRD